MKKVLLVLLIVGVMPFTTLAQAKPSKKSAIDSFVIKKGETLYESQGKTKNGVSYVMIGGKEFWIKTNQAIQLDGAIKTASVMIYLSDFTFLRYRIIK